MEKIKNFLSDGNLTKNVLAYIWSIASIVFLFVAVIKPVPQANEKIIYLFIGIFSGVIGTVISFYFGSSQGSDEKSKILGTKLNEIINTNTQNIQP